MIVNNNYKRLLQILSLILIVLIAGTFYLIVVKYKQEVRNITNKRIPKSNPSFTPGELLRFPKTNTIKIAKIFDDTDG